MILILIIPVFWISAVINDSPDFLDCTGCQYGEYSDDLPAAPDRERFNPRAIDIPKGSYNSK